MKSRLRGKRKRTKATTQRLGEIRTIGDARLAKIKKKNKRLLRRALPLPRLSQV